MKNCKQKNVSESLRFLGMTQYDVGEVGDVWEKLIVRGMG